MPTAVFIGTFDPLHGAHIGQLLRAHSYLPLSKIYILVDKNPLHKPNASSWQHRTKMAQLTLEIAQPSFNYEVIPVESSLARDFIQSVDYKITGIDSLLENLSDPMRWAFTQRWPMIVLSIPGIPYSNLTESMMNVPKAIQQTISYKYIDEATVPMMNYDFETQTFVARRVHATNLRAGQDVSAMPRSVREYIKVHNLYPTSPTNDTIDT